MFYGGVADSDATRHVVRTVVSGHSILAWSCRSSGIVANLVKLDQEPVPLFPLLFPSFKGAELLSQFVLGRSLICLAQLI
jgi:hypothetical protein